MQIESIRFQADFEGLYKDHQSIQPSNLVDVEILFEFMRWALTFALKRLRAQAFENVGPNEKSKSDPFVALHGILCDCVN